MTDRGKRYLELVDEVKQDYKDKLRKNSNVTLKGCDYCREINLWTYWQGLGYAENTPEIDILLVGQDWGNPNNPSQTVENIKTINMEMTGRILFSICKMLIWKGVMHKPTII